MCWQVYKEFIGIISRWTDSLSIKTENSSQDPAHTLKKLLTVAVYFTALYVGHLFALCNFKHVLYGQQCLAQWIRNGDFMTHCSSSQVLSDRKVFISGSWPKWRWERKKKVKTQEGGEARASSAVVKITATRKTATWTTAALHCCLTLSISFQS